MLIFPSLSHLFISSSQNKWTFSSHYSNKCLGHCQQRPPFCNGHFCVLLTWPKSSMGYLSFLNNFLFLSTIISQYLMFLFSFISLTTYSKLSLLPLIHHKILIVKYLQVCSSTLMLSIFALFLFNHM